MIVESETMESDLRGIILHFGGFHREMSLLGCIRCLMTSTGLQEMLDLTYIPNAVVHMLSGKTIARAIHAHFIVDAALNTLMLKSMLNTHFSCQPEISDSPMKEIKNFLKWLQGHQMSSVKM